MTRPADIPEWAWERARKAIASQRPNESLSEAVARALKEERSRAASIAYRTCAETRHVTLGDRCADAIMETGNG